MDDELICYCFAYNRKDIKDDLRKNGYSRIVQKIQAAKKLGSCQCATKNPKGR